MYKRQTQGLWHNSSELLQLPVFDDDLVAKAEGLHVKSIGELVDMDDPLRQQLFAHLDSSQVSRIAEGCNRFPCVDLQILQSNDTHVSVRIEYDMDEDQPLSPVISPQFPVPRSEAWWLVVGCPQSNTILALKKIPLRSSTTEITLSISANGGQSLGQSKNLYLICDSYFGVDIELSMSQ